MAISRLHRELSGKLLILFVILALGLQAQETIVVDSIMLEGNKKTHPSVIFREITFRQGDTLSVDELITNIAVSRQNLLNLPLFNFVETAVVQGSPQGRSVVFTFTERWYIWPYPIVEVADRNFNAWWKTKNLSRINIGGYVLVENFRGRLERLKLLVNSGFDQKFETEYFIPYLNRQKTIGLLFQAGVMGNHEVAATTNANHQVVFLRDENKYIRTHIHVYAAVVYRPALYNSHEAGFGWSANQIADTLHTAFATLWPNKHEQFLTLRYQFKHDRRDYRHYPLKGHYFDLTLSGNLPVQATNTGRYYLEGDVNLRYYGRFDNRFYWAAGAYGRVSSRNPVSYYLMQGLGSGRYFVRGYEYYLIEGQQTALLRSNLIYNILRPTEKHIPFIQNEKFGRVHFAAYLRVFADWGISHNTRPELSGKLSDRWLGGYGVGFDLVTYYDRVLRVEYSFNRMGESGLFVHFMASI